MTDSGAAPFVALPLVFSRPPPIQDILATDTSNAQHEMVRECLPWLTGANKDSSSRAQPNVCGVPLLDRQQHVHFLRDSLEDLPAGFVSADASRPWMVYWALMGLYLLGEDVSQYRDRVIKTLAPMQNATGGFGGGHGQYSHLAATYAATLSLALVGGTDAYGLIHRESMWRWLCRLKQADGGFRVCEGGEEDVRGAYCAMVLISLLDLPSQTIGGPANGLQDGLEDWVARCQTFEGGISGAPGNEAHGAYAFCAIACLSLLNEQQHALRSLNLSSLLSWLASRQYAPEGGFAGRTNKLVDGCYSHWVGGCWPLIHAAMNGPRATDKLMFDDEYAAQSMCSREGLARYILSCCQSQHGGLRDKPSKMADSYHTCYTLAGLSSVQHLHYFISNEDLAHSSHDSSSSSSFRWRSVPLSNLREDPSGGFTSQRNVLEPFHPVFAIAHQAVHNIREWSEEQNRCQLVGRRS